MKSIRLILVCGAFLLSSAHPSGANGSVPSAMFHSTVSIARVWNEQNLTAIRVDTPHPPVHARNLFHLSVVMYDAWAAYDPKAVGYIYRKKHRGLTEAAVAESRREAISYAAYRMLKERYAYSKSASKTFSALDAQMLELGYRTNNLFAHISAATRVGESVYSAVSAHFRDDGCY